MYAQILMSSILHSVRGAVCLRVLFSAQHKLEVCCVQLARHK